VDPTGLTHLGAREYDPAIGRFISADPIVDPHDPQQMQGYAYAENSPITGSDPTGLRNCTGPRDCGSDLTHGNPTWGKGTTAASSSKPPKATKAQQKLWTPAFGHAPSSGELKWLRNAGYQGSDDFTWGEALQWAAGSPDGWEFVCQNVAGQSSATCAHDPFTGENLDDDHHVQIMLIGLVMAGGAAACVAFVEACVGAVVTGAAAVGDFAATGGAMTMFTGAEVSGAGFLAVMAGAMRTLFGQAEAEALVGPGQWIAKNEAMSARAAAYQLQITGVARGTVYDVGGVAFDGYIDGMLIDAKGPGYAWAVKNGEFQSWFGGQQGLIDQATRQLNVAGETPITWFVAEPEAATAMENLFANNGITGITIVHTPPV